jgi:hypothetical protein
MQAWILALKRTTKGSTVDLAAVRQAVVPAQAFPAQLGPLLM